MSEDKIRYDILVREALRGIVRTVLQRVQKRGLPGNHHFYISFDTSAPGTVLSSRLKAQYPDEMLIVLQHKFWDLMVYDDRFEVKLTFNGVPERLVIPFAAVNNFADPSVQFGFQPNRLVPVGSADAVTDDPESEDVHESAGAVRAEIHGDRLIELETEPEPESVAKGKAKEPADETASESAKVVELDLFRKR
jgi:hypothetical protein